MNEAQASESECKIIDIRAQRKNGVLPIPHRNKEVFVSAELAILKVLWAHGRASVCQVQAELTDRGTGYTSTLKLMQIMLQKGLVRRDDSTHAHVYEAAITRKRAQCQFVGEMVDQVFEGSAQRLVMQALSSKKSTPAELAEIRKLLDEIAGSQK